MRKINRKNLPIGIGKKTVRCTPLEILGRIDGILRALRKQTCLLETEALKEIEFRLEEWKNS